MEICEDKGKNPRKNPTQPGASGEDGLLSEKYLLG